MTHAKAARRYAKSLLMYVQEKKVLEDAYRDMLLIIETCRKNRLFLAMLQNPVVNIEHKKVVITKVLSGHINQATMSFLGLVLHNHRESILMQIAHEFISEYKTLKGITTATVSTVVALDEQLREQIRNMVKTVATPEVWLEEKIAPELIGGFILRFSNLQFDTSIARSLSQYRMNFNRNLFESKIIKK